LADGLKALESMKADERNYVMMEKGRACWASLGMFCMLIYVQVQMMKDELCLL
jgi:hypothetical protein